MTKKERIAAEIEKAKTKRQELNEKIANLERRYKEEETLELHEIVRKAKLTPEQVDERDLIGLMDEDEAKEPEKYFEIAGYEIQQKTFVAVIGLAMIALICFAGFIVLTKKKRQRQRSRILMRIMTRITATRSTSRKTRWMMTISMSN